MIVVIVVETKCLSSNVSFTQSVERDPVIDDTPPSVPNLGSSDLRLRHGK